MGTMFSFCGEMHPPLLYAEGWEGCPACGKDRIRLVTMKLDGRACTTFDPAAIGDAYEEGAGNEGPEQEKRTKGRSRRKGRA